jgi:hypothetical protein
MKINEVERLDEEFFAAAGWWLLTNPIVVAKILLALAVIWQVVTVAASTFAMYKTLKWILRKVGIMDEPDEVVKKAKADKGYMKRVSHKIADYFKNAKDAKKVQQEVKTGMTQAMAMKK